MKARCLNAVSDLDLSSRIFLKGRHCVAVASLGQIVEGYAVVFGSEKYINLRDYPPADASEFLRFIYFARMRVENCYGPTVMFEHGASLTGSAVSCGVNRVHLHIVPVHFRSLREHLEETFRREGSVPTLEEGICRLKNSDASEPYFWVEEQGQVHLFSYGEQRESQVVRRALAEQMGLGDRWDWRKYPTQGAAERVAERLSPSGISMFAKPSLETLA